MLGTVHTAPAKDLDRIRMCRPNGLSIVLLCSDWVGPSAISRRARCFTAAVKDINAH